MSIHNVAALIGVASLAGLVCEAAAQAQDSTLTREAALERALADDPNVAAADASERAADASVRQAGRWSNPTLEVTRENFEGSGVYAGSDRAETTYALRQPLELGGDRGARRDIAESDRDLARVGAGLRRLDVIEEVEDAFVDAQAAEAARVVAEERLAVARELAEAVNRRVQAARDPFMAGSRAQARLAEAEIEVESARRTAISTRNRLATYWSGAGDFSVELASFEQLSDVSPDALQGAIPDTRLAEAQQGRAEAQLRLERARQIPNADLQAGLREFSETDETALVVGVAVPLQIWDRNSDNIARARAERDRAGHQREAFARSGCSSARGLDEPAGHGASRSRRPRRAGYSKQRGSAPLRARRLRSRRVLLH